MNSNDIFYLSKYIKIYIITSTGNQNKSINEIFYILFFCMKSLKPDMYITLITHLNLEWLYLRAQNPHVATILDSLILDQVT